MNFKTDYKVNNYRFHTSKLTGRLHIGKSNSKLGKMISIGYVSGNDNITLKSGEIVTDCEGTCSGVNCSECSKCCYAIRSFRQYPSKTINCIENTMQLRTNMTQHFLDISNYIEANNIKVVRYTESGEIESLRQFTELMRVATINNETTFYLYTKNYAVLRAYFDLQELPKNVYVLVSVWNNNGVNEWNEFKSHNNVKCFAVGNYSLGNGAHCPAYKTVDGKSKRVNVSCADCKLCFNNSTKIVYCNLH